MSGLHLLERYDPTSLARWKHFDKLYAPNSLHLLRHSTLCPNQPILKLSHPATPRSSLLRKYRRKPMILARSEHAERHFTSLPMLTTDSLHLKVEWSLSIMDLRDLSAPQRACDTRSCSVWTLYPFLPATPPFILLLKFTAVASVLRAPMSLSPAVLDSIQLNSSNLLSVVDNLSTPFRGWRIGSLEVVEEAEIQGR